MVQRRALRARVARACVGSTPTSRIEMNCPTPQKKAYETRVAALFFAETDGPRAYRCSCGKWHLSSQPRTGKPMGVSKRRAARSRNLKRSKPLKADPQKVREWQQRSRKQTKRKLSLKPRERTPEGYEGAYGVVVWRENLGSACQCCGKPSRRLVGHHVTYRQQIRQTPNGLMWDIRNRMVLDQECHEKHHNRSRVIPLATLPDSAYEYAADLLGPEKAFEYLRRRYAGDDPKLDPLLTTEIAPFPRIESSFDSLGSKTAW